MDHLIVLQIYRRYSCWSVVPWSLLDQDWYYRKISIQRLEMFSRIISRSQIYDSIPSITINVPTLEIHENLDSPWFLSIVPKNRPRN